MLCGSDPCTLCDFDSMQLSCGKFNHMIKPKTTIQLYKWNHVHGLMPTTCAIIVCVISFAITLLMGTKTEAQFASIIHSWPINISLKKAGTVYHSALPWLLSKTCQMRVGAWVVFKWLHLTWTGRQLTGNHHKLASVICHWFSIVMSTASICSIWLCFSGHQLNCMMLFHELLYYFETFDAFLQLFSSCTPEKPLVTVKSL